jgi:uncharacterized cupin superfamily protein
MTRTLSLSLALSVLAFGATTAFADDTTHGATADPVESTVLKAEDRVFFEAFGPVQFADAFGSREEGPHGTYGVFPGGFETPDHTHSHGYRAVVLVGEMTNPFAGEENSPVMTPGSFWSVKAGEAHTTACVSEEACTFLMWGDQSFDFVPHNH